MGVSPLEIVAFGFALTLLLTALATLPHAWKGLRWAQHWGDSDERRIGSGIWWQHLGIVATAIAFTLFGIWCLIIRRDHLPHPDYILVAILFVLAGCGLLLIGEWRLERRFAPGNIQPVRQLRDNPPSSSSTA